MMIARNLELIREEIVKTCEAAGRDPSVVTLVAVSKTVQPARIVEAIRAGVTDLGENWVQEAVAKRPMVEEMLRGAAATEAYSPSVVAAETGHSKVRWHMIGHLQTNKVKKALEVFDFFQGVDSEHLAQEMSRRAAQAKKRVPVLVEVNTSGEASKFGVAPELVLELARCVVQLPGLELRGLMTIGPGLSVEEPEQSRSCFRLLRRLRDDVQTQLSCELPVLSMGMSSDFRVAIQEGSTMLRIGTAIFGARRA